VALGDWCYFYPLWRITSARLPVSVLEDEPPCREALLDPGETSAVADAKWGVARAAAEAGRFGTEVAAAIDDAARAARTFALPARGRPWGQGRVEWRCCGGCCCPAARGGAVQVPLGPSTFWAHVCLKRGNQLGGVPCGPTRTAADRTRRCSTHEVALLRGLLLFRCKRSTPHPQLPNPQPSTLGVICSHASFGCSGHPQPWAAGSLLARTLLFT
jgi:hypothetical protein